MSAQLYEEEKKKQEETGSVCSHCSSNLTQHSRRGSEVVTVASAIPKTFFGKARTKNKVHKLPGEKTE